MLERIALGAYCLHLLHASRLRDEGARSAVLGAVANVLGAQARRAGDGNYARTQRAEHGKEPLRPFSQNDQYRFTRPKAEPMQRTGKAAALPIHVPVGKAPLFSSVRNPVQGKAAAVFCPKPDDIFGEVEPSRRVPTERCIQLFVTHEPNSS
ncbi:hypothetical protein HRbin30_03165 [bacterium HR30]|nr:hypothetical protein HRbin30_03165 [bacterium HR30]